MKNSNFSTLTTVILTITFLILGLIFWKYILILLLIFAVLIGGVIMYAYFKLRNNVKIIRHKMQEQNPASSAERESFVKNENVMEAEYTVVSDVENE